MAYRGQQTIPGAPVLESVKQIVEAQEYGVKGMKWGRRKSRDERRKGRSGSPHKGIDLYAAFGERGPSNIAGQLKNLHKMKGAKDIVTPDRKISINRDVWKRTGPTIDGDAQGRYVAKKFTFKTSNPKGFTKAALVKAAIKLIRKTGGEPHHYMRDVVLEGIKRRKDGTYDIEVGA